MSPGLFGVSALAVLAVLLGVAGLLCLVAPLVSAATHHDFLEIEPFPHMPTEGEDDE